MPSNIIVAGGGIGGLATALALSSQGHRIDLIEQAPAFAEIGAGVQLGPNATRRLIAMGLGKPLAAIAAKPDALTVRSAANNAVLARLPLGSVAEHRYRAPYYCAHRADLHALLLKAVRARKQVALSTGARIVEVRRDDEFVCVASADARAWEGDALVGADGLWSRVRQQVVEHDAPPRATGHMAWRAIVSQQALPAALRCNGVEVWLGPKLHAVAYPVRGGRWLNVVVIAESKPTGDVRDWDQASSLAALQGATGRSGAGLQKLLEAMPAWRTWALSDRPPLKNADQMASGRIALLGDAAHPMLPYLAQGAGMAIEDAVALAEALGNTDAAGLPQAFARYADARWQRNARVQARAQRNGAIFHATGPVRLGRDVAMRVLGKALLDQPWLFQA
ncbi:FAD-dependent monooxygenase [Variovorax rhizosphaerae]|uniref:FAD-dependent monooxygenase n=1 Tax=Variovorax rhizosphaerae TaxID=1836200 RepID=A0ABU8WNG6_9BURK